MIIQVNNMIQQPDRMSIGESRTSSRGPLIAVIKIEIEEGQVDRIFLHQHDDDYRLAEEFQTKHGLSGLFVEHIYQRIKASRDSLSRNIGTPIQDSHASNRYDNNKHLRTQPNPIAPNLLDTPHIQHDVSILPYFQQNNARISRHHPQSHSYQYHPQPYSRQHAKMKDDININEYDRIQNINRQQQNMDKVQSQQWEKQHNNLRGLAERKITRFAVVPQQGRGEEEQAQNSSHQDPALNLDVQQSPHQQNRKTYIPNFDNNAKYQNSTFQTFMQNSDPHSQNHHNLWEKYLKQKGKRDQSLYGVLIEKPIQNQQRSFSYNKTPYRELNQAYPHPDHQQNMIHSATDMRQAFIRPQSQRKLHSDQNKEDQIQQNKPKHVKIIRKQQFQSLNSSLAGTRKNKSVSRMDKERIAKEVTSRLYNESDIKKNYLNKIKERAKIEKLQKEDKQLTHRPQINKVSQLIAADRYGDVAIQDYLLGQAKKVQVKIEAERALKAQKQLEGCSFQPAINTISQKLVKDKEKDINRSRNSLLKDKSRKNLSDACSRKHSQSQMAFRPSLNKLSEEIVKNKGQGNFEQRLKSFLEQKNIKLNELNKQKKAKQKMDESGQQLFRPRIKSKGRRSPKGSQIHEYLYELSKVERMTALVEQRPQINENSEQIIQQMYMKRIAWLFSQLDSDQDGFISPKRICIDTISEQILEVIIPVLFEMEEMDIELNLLDFRNAVRNLHPSLNAHQKSVLYSYRGKGP